MRTIDAVYGLGAGIFFIGYFIFEVLSNLILHKVGARLGIARIMITWAIISGATLLAKTPMSAIPYLVAIPVIALTGMSSDRFRIGEVSGSMNLFRGGAGSSGPVPIVATKERPVPDSPGNASPGALRRPPSCSADSGCFPRWSDAHPTRPYPS
jgi:hypothetical protein